MMLPTSSFNLLVDASNAFSNLNCQLALANIASSYMLPSLTSLLTRNNAKLFVRDQTILPQEETTQGGSCYVCMLWH